MSVFTGYFLSAVYIPLNESEVFAQDALDAIEYANGAIDTKYGKMRADNGHPDPFNLNRMEVGNEEYLMQEYADHYKLITGAIWE